MLQEQQKGGSRPHRSLGLGMLQGLELGDEQLVVDLLEASDRPCSQQPHPVSQEHGHQRAKLQPQEQSDPDHVAEGMLLQGNRVDLLPLLPTEAEGRSEPPVCSQVLLASATGEADAQGCPVLGCCLLMDQDGLSGAMGCEVEVRALDSARISSGQLASVSDSASVPPALLEGVGHPVLEVSFLRSRRLDCLFPDPTRHRLLAVRTRHHVVIYHGIQRRRQG